MYSPKRKTRRNKCRWEKDGKQMVQQWSTQEKGNLTWGEAADEETPAPGGTRHFLTLTETCWPGGKHKGSPQDTLSAPRGPFLHQQTYFLRNYAAEVGGETLWTTKEGRSKDSVRRKPGRAGHAPHCCARESTFNIRSRHIPFDDIISLRGGVLQGWCDKNQVLHKY